MSFFIKLIPILVLISLTHAAVLIILSCVVFIDALTYSVPSGFWEGCYPANQAKTNEKKKSYIYRFL
jgi:hypothetical protein